MSLLEELGLDEDRFEWTDLALCASLDTELFYDKYEEDEEIAKATDQICLHCPVMKECFFAGAEGQHGVWGGVFWNGSGKPDKNKNSHKTEEVWESIQDAVR